MLHGMYSYQKKKKERRIIVYLKAKVTGNPVFYLTTLPEGVSFTPVSLSFPIWKMRGSG